MHVTIIAHFPKTDKHCTGECSWVEVKCDDKSVARYENALNDSGPARAETFVNGIEWVLKGRNEEMILSRWATNDLEAE